MYCCESFKSLVENAGKKGLSLTFKKESEFNFFCLQSRGVDFAEAEKAKRGELKLPGVNLAHQIGIQYCPFCGIKLADWIVSNQSELKELIDRSKQFLL